MRVALVHDYLREYGGAERVLEAIHEIWPGAPLYTAFVDWEALGSHAARFRKWDIRPSWVQKNPLVKKLHSPLRFLAPKIWESFDLSNFDVVISSSGWFICRGVKAGRRIVGDPSTRSAPSGRALHVCYIHHPPRALYGYATGSFLTKYWPVKAYATVVNFFMRHYDFATAQKVDYFIANSQETSRRVSKFYRRESIVIYPPIDIRNLKAPAKKSYFLSVGRLMWAKRVDLAIAAANRLKLPLKIVGVGQEEKRLRTLAGPTVEFLGAVSDFRLAHLYAGAKAVIFCALDEDFGMVPVEAMAYGTPVIGLAQGGVLETVAEGKTGVLFAEPTSEAATAALKKFLKTDRDWQVDCRKQASRFSKENFRQALTEFVEKKYRQRPSSH